MLGSSYVGLVRVPCSVTKLDVLRSLKLLLLKGKRCRCMLKYVGRFRMLMKARAEWVMLHGFRQQCWLLLMLQSQRALQRDIHDGIFLLF